jgi:hypothetical protein
MFFLHTPSHSKFLTPEERKIVTELMKLDSHDAEAASDVDSERFSCHWVKIAVLNWKNDTHRCLANLLTVPPNIAAFIAVLIVTYYSDRLAHKGSFMLLGATLGIIGYIMLLTSPAHSSNTAAPSSWLWASSPIHQSSWVG